ncbi:hypothetical protein MGN70_004041 [Eutypa lata]|nr:hypothetical protein MGN70_004041 [Eutypa lata]
MSSKDSKDTVPRTGQGASGSGSGIVTTPYRSQPAMTADHSHKEPYRPHPPMVYGRQSDPGVIEPDDNTGCSPRTGCNGSGSK